MAAKTESVRVDLQRFEKLATVAKQAKDFDFKKKQLLDMAMEMAIQAFEDEIATKEKRARSA